MTQAFLAALCLTYVFASGVSDAVKTIYAQRPAKESMIPKELLEKVKALQGDRGDSEKFKKISFMNVEAFFFDEHRSLFEIPVKVVTPVGGGSVDLDKILPGGKAKFSVRILLRGSDESASEILKPTQVYFVPQLKQKFGKECGYFYDITSFYNKRLGSDEGFETYITDGIYAHNLVGSFVFVKVEEKKVLVSNLNFTDSRFLAQTCAVKM